MDIAIVWDVAHGRGDWGCTPTDLQVDPGGIRSAVLVSLFTDRVASADYVAPPGSQPGRRGWWGDTYESSPIGSRLWQLNRAVKSDAVTLLNRAKDFCLEALQWLVDDGVAATVAVATWWAQPTVIGIAVTIVAPNGTTQKFQFSWAWEGA